MSQQRANGVHRWRRSVCKDAEEGAYGGQGAHRVPVRVPRGALGKMAGQLPLYGRGRSDTLAPTMAELGHPEVSGIEMVSTAKRESEELHMMFVFAVAFRPQACTTGP